MTRSTRDGRRAAARRRGAGAAAWLTGALGALALGACEAPSSEPAAPPAVAPPAVAPPAVTAPAAPVATPRAAGDAEARFVAAYAAIECDVARGGDASARDERMLLALTEHGYDLATYVADKRRFGGGAAAGEAVAACRPAVAEAPYAPSDEVLVAVAGEMKRLSTLELAPADRDERERSLLTRHRLTRAVYDLATRDRLADPAFAARVEAAAEAAPSAATGPGRLPDLAALPTLEDDYPRVVGAAIARTCVLSAGLPVEETARRIAEIERAYGLTGPALEERVAYYEGHPRFVAQFRSGTSTCAPADMELPRDGLWTGGPPPAAAPPAAPVVAGEAPAAGAPPTSAVAPAATTPAAPVATPFADSPADREPPR